MSKFIVAVPDYINVSIINFINIIYDVIFGEDKAIKYYNTAYNKIYGYSCRSIFHSIIDILVTERKCETILLTPMQHTSYYNIVNKYFKKENIHILELNENFDKIVNIPNKIEKYDICLVTHMFGKDMNMDILADLNSDCIIIEDRVQGGSITKRFSNDIINISLYSCGMDKIPCALGGGVSYIKNNLDFNMTELLYERICSYSEESKLYSLYLLLIKVPTYLLYNIRCFLLIILYSLYITNINLHKVTCSYRKVNPGFSHDDYLKKPSSGLITNINKSFKNSKKIEKRIELKTKMFFSYLPDNIIRKYFPWKGDNILYTNYNTIYIKTDMLEFTKLLSDKHILYLINPTYKIFNDNDNLTEKFIYLPCLINMTRKEMEYLANIIIKFDKNI